MLELREVGHGHWPQILLKGRRLLPVGSATTERRATCAYVLVADVGLTWCHFSAIVAHMDLTPFLEALRHDLAVAAAAGGDDARELAERLIAPLDVAARLMLLEALTHAAEEISLELAPGAVEVRLRGRDPEFVVRSPPTDGHPPSTAPMAPVVPSDDDGGTARLNLRLPESLKRQIDTAASAEGLSLNAWLVRAAAAALATRDARRPSPTTMGQRFTGWAR
jgi:hypothetical protein